MFTVDIKKILSSPNYNGKQVTELAIKYKHAKTEAKREYYKTLVVENTLRLAYKFCLPTLRLGREHFEDHFQVAVMGILEALDRFDEKKKFMFSTYANFWMKNYTGAHHQQMDTVKHPRDAYIGARRYENIVNEAIADDVSLEAVLRRRKITKKKFNEWERDFQLKSDSKRVLRLDKKQHDYNENRGNNLVEVILSNKGQTHEFHIESEQALQKIRDIAAVGLNDDEMFVVKSRFLNEEQKEYIWIAKQLGYGVDKVKSIERKALAKIKTLLKKGYSHE